jgi:hypothetical protein
MVHIDQSYDKFIKLATQIEIKNSEAFLRIKKRICKEIGLPCYCGFNQAFFMPWKMHLLSNRKRNAEKLSQQ